MICLKRDNNRRRKKITVIVGTVAVVFCGSIILNFSKPNLLSPVTHFIFRPILEAQGGFWGGARSAWEFMRSKNSLVAENQALKEKLVLFEAVEQERDYYKGANAELLKLADSSSALPNVSFVRILSKPGFSPYDTVIIDAGKDNGIKNGDRVLADEDTILGIVSETYAKTSVVTLYSSPERETTVLVGMHSIEVVAIGKGGGNFEIKLPRNTEVAIGDSVTLASSSPAMLGAIGYIKTSSADSFERAIFKSSADINKLSFVTILKQ